MVFVNHITITLVVIYPFDKVLLVKLRVATKLLVHVVMECTDELEISQKIIKPFESLFRCNIPFANHPIVVAIIINEVCINPCHFTLFFKFTFLTVVFLFSLRLHTKILVCSRYCLLRHRTVLGIGI